MLTYKRKDFITYYLVYTNLLAKSLTSSRVLKLLINIY
jgi:hypothetical protein